MSAARGARTDAQARHLPAVLLLPAMGVAHAYYRPLVEQLEHLGHAVTMADFDTAEHDGRAERLDGYAELIEGRIRSGFHSAAESTPTGRVVVVGHSVCGQLGLIFAGRFAPELPVILVGSGSAYFRGFSGFRKWMYLLASQVIAGLASALRVWPGDKLGFGGRQTARTMHDWARNVRTGRYRSRDASFDYQAALRDFRGALAVIDIEGDVLAPPTSTDRLVGHSGAVVTRREVYVPQRGSGKPGAHFTWARDVPGVAPRIASLLSDPGFTEGHLRNERLRPGIL